eukprot:350574-Amphidinium_carterae.1
MSETYAPETEFLELLIAQVYGNISSIRVVELNSTTSELPHKAAELPPRIIESVVAGGVT